MCVWQQLGYRLQQNTLLQNVSIVSTILPAVAYTGNGYTHPARAATPRCHYTAGFYKGCIRVGSSAIRLLFLPLCQVEGKTVQ
jgi:hypothetical protein